MACVSKVNIRVPQGTTYRHEFSYVDEAGAAVDLTNYTARCQFRETLESTTPFFDATTANGKIEITPLTGLIVLEVPHEDSSAFTILKGFYDIEIIAPNSDVIRVVQGRVTVDREVTR